MGTIALTVKKDNFKTPLLEATYQVTPFLNYVSFFECFFSFKIGFFTAMKKVKVSDYVEVSDREDIHFSVSVL